VATNGIDAMVLTKVDVLDEFETLKICTGYMSQGRVLGPSDGQHLPPEAP